jgi:hypothetical protein
MKYGANVRINNSMHKLRVFFVGGIVEERDNKVVRVSTAR